MGTGTCTVVCRALAAAVNLKPTQKWSYRVRTVCAPRPDRQRFEARATHPAQRVSRWPATYEHSPLTSEEAKAVSWYYPQHPERVTHFLVCWRLGTAFHPVQWTGEEWAAAAHETVASTETDKNSYNSLVRYTLKIRSAREIETPSRSVHSRRLYIITSHHHTWR